MPVEELELDELELEDELLLLEPPELGGRHGGTINVVTLLLAGSTSWLVGEVLAVSLVVFPPGVIRMVLAGGGATASLLELLELLELLLELLLIGDPHGSIATV